MIEVLKQALEALKDVGVLTDREWQAVHKNKANELRQAIAKAEDNYQGSDAAKAAHMMDLYTALGVRWGDDPFAVIAKKRSIAELESQKQGEPVACKECHLKDTVYDLLGDLKVANLKLSVRSQRTWVGLTDEEIDQGLLRSDYALKTAEAWRAGVVFAMTQLKEKNT